MFTCSICGRSVELPAIYSLDPTHPICTVCVHKFDDLVKNPDNTAFSNAFDYFSSFISRESSDQYIKSALKFYLDQNTEKYKNLSKNASGEIVAAFLKKSSDEIEILKEEIQRIKTEKAEKEQKEQIEKKAREKETLLDSIGLYSFVRSYSLDKPSGYVPIPSYSESIDNQTLYWSNGQKTYPEISDDEFEQIKEIVEKKEELEKEKRAQVNPTPEREPESLPQPQSFTNVPPKESVLSSETKRKPLSFHIRSNNVTQSFAESFLGFLAWVEYIGGLIVSIIISRREVLVSSYRTETQFSWSIFFISIFFFFLSGSVLMCLSELFGNINSIAVHLGSFTLDEIEEKEKWKL